MPRNMSFSMTTKQMKAKTKTVTRRFGWDFIKTGDFLMAVEKGMGLKKGEKVKKIGLIKVVSIRKEPLDRISSEDVIKEGFPDMTPELFIQMIVKHYRLRDRSVIINRIEFDHVNRQEEKV